VRIRASDTALTSIGRRVPRLAGLALLLALFAWIVQDARAARRHGVEPPPSSIAEQLFREGKLAGDKPLIGQREGAPPVSGRDAACAQCHRRSGLGAVEGRIVIPPITGRFLFHPGERIAPESDASHSPPTPPDRSAYDDATLARAIREGIGADGRLLDYLMPRYPLDDAALRELVGYLRGLSVGPVPGVGRDTLNFATIVAPDADPVARDGMLKVIQEYFDSKNSFYRGDAAPPLQSARRIHFRVQRKWQLHVWQLTGAPQTWGAQLDQHLREEPVYAVISGIGGGTWAPVHEFCERQSLPCLFPNIDLPVVASDDFYPVYFSQGVLLEAQLITSRTPTPAAGRIVQVFRADDAVGAAAAAALRDAAKERGAIFVDRALRAADGARQLAAAIADLKAGDTLVLWLRAADLMQLPAAPPEAATIYLSGAMGGLENAPLAAAWRARVAMTYPYELPDIRRVRLNYPLGWFNIRKIPLVAERVQVDTYIACSVLAETLASMLDSFVRDFLVERVEVMLSARIINGYYTRLGLAPGQRFASKGGYLVRFADPNGKRVVADGEWIVP